MTRARGLGRGLDALIPTAPATSGVLEIDPDLIVFNPYQPRMEMSEESLRELAQSIREHGVLQPLLVSTSHPEGTYQLIAGERRLRAARIAGLRRLPVVVREVASSEQLELALVENLQRQDLNALEEAQAYRRLADEFGMTQEAIAARVGRSRTSVANAMRLLALDADIKASLASAEISEGHARALLAIEGEGDRREVWRAVVERSLTVRQTEELARGRHSATQRQRRAPGDADLHTAALEARLRETLGTKIDLRRRPNGRGRMVLHFYSDEELQALLDRLGVSADEA